MEYTPSKKTTASKPPKAPSKGGKAPPPRADRPTIRHKFPESFLLDLQSLKIYEPRRQAIEWIKAGRLDDFMDWESTEGFAAAKGPNQVQSEDSLRRQRTLFSPFWLDRELINRMGATKSAVLADACEMAAKELECFEQSPIEIVIRESSDEPFDALLEFCSGPKFRFADSDSSLFNRASWNLNRFIARSQEKMTQEILDISSEPCWDMLLLALLTGRQDRAQRMVGAGLCPSHQWEWTSFIDRIEAFSKLGSQDLEDACGLPNAPIQAALDWAWEKMRLAQELEELFEKSIPAKESSAKFDAALKTLLDQRAPVCYFALAEATEAGRLDVLQSLFAAGGNPNCRYKTGVPMLARLDTEKLTEEALQIWLDAGARPSMPEGSSEPFGGGLCPAPLYQFAWHGRLDLAKCCLERAQGPVDLLEPSQGKIYNTIFSVALARDKADLAAWLVEEKGCLLEHLNPDDGEPCVTLAHPETLPRIQAAQERASSYDLPPVSRQGSRRRRGI